MVTGEEIDIERGDGSRGTIVVNSAPIRAASGTVVAGVATFQDVSDRVEAQRRVEELYEAELRARTIAEAAWRRVERLQRITVALAEAVSPPQVADVIVRNGRSLLAAVGAWVGLLDDAGADIVMLGSSRTRCGWAGRCGWSRRRRWPWRTRRSLGAGRSTRARSARYRCCPLVGRSGRSRCVSLASTPSTRRTGPWR